MICYFAEIVSVNLHGNKEDYTLLVIHTFKLSISITFLQRRYIDIVRKLISAESNKMNQRNFRKAA
jgi:hypothetical protein